MARLKMKYPKVQKVDYSLDDAMMIYEDMGYKFIGEGCYATVYRKGNHVLKFGHVNTTSYINYVRMIGLRSKNPHLPYITHVDIYDTCPDTAWSNPYYIVRMEVLEPMIRSFYTVNDDQLESMSRQWKSYWYSQIGAENAGEAFSPEAIAESRHTPKTQAMLEVRDILGHLYRNYNACCDLGESVHTSNIMYRSGTPVFTDPVV